MKKGTNKSGSAYSEQESTNKDIAVYSCDKVLANAKQTAKGNGMVYPLSDDIRLTIIEKEDQDDTALLSIFGVITIFANVRSYSDKNGETKCFLAFPSYKKKDGSYFDYVSNYSKNLNALIKELFSRIYN